MYDYLIVGSGFFGSICAYELNKQGYKCIVIDKRNHIGGNCYTSNRDGINVHDYGPHIFHTSNEEVWKWINQFTKFNNYVNTPVANYKGEIYSLPFNMWTFSKLWNITHPDQAKKIIEEMNKYKRIITDMYINLDYYKQNFNNKKLDIKDLEKLNKVVKFTVDFDNINIMKKLLKNPRILFPFFMALIMAFIMSGVLTAINTGLDINFIFRWIKSFAIGFLVAFPTAIFVAPLVQKIVKKIIES